MKISNGALTALLLLITADASEAMGRIPFLSSSHYRTSLSDKTRTTFVRDVIQSLRGGESTETQVDDETQASVSTSDPIISSTPDEEIKEQTDTSKKEEEESLEDKVHAAMRRLGLSPPTDTQETSSSSEAQVECKDGVCELPSTSTSSTTAPSKPLEDAHTMTQRLAKELSVDESIVHAALGATMTPESESEGLKEEERLNEDAARIMIQNEMDAISRVMEDCDEVRVFGVMLRFGEKSRRVHTHRNISISCFDFVSLF